ncbi:hypothetical protein ALC57_04561 [Trachymyrmex cornetzi]|uniref:Uncharacterized protein n=1 Tax=Trachymyrmex cornetzi TaxID=471704 RepID=A0A195ECE5_9HYME|nr:hypothetical protein ALC57_04561 [Trachymyrmex cornetzi]
MRKYASFLLHFCYIIYGWQVVMAETKLKKTIANRNKFWQLADILLALFGYTLF